MAKKNSYENVFDFNAEQRELERLILERNDEGKVIFCSGRAGTGKNFTSVWACIKKKEDLKHVQLYYTRAVIGVDNEEIGFLPGEVKDKFEEYVHPLNDSFDAIVRLTGEQYNVNSLKQMWNAAPITFLRGRTFHQTMFIIDECQNLSYTQLKTILNRIGQYSTFILLGDPDQIDNAKQFKLKKNRGTCDFELVMNFLSTKKMPVVKMVEVRRSGMAGLLSEWFEELEKDL